MNNTSLLFCVLALASITGCPDATTPSDAGRDSGSTPLDSAALDTASTTDDTGTTTEDTGAVGVDSGTAAVDSGRTTPDAGPGPDAGMCVDFPPSPTRPAPVTCSACRPPSLAGGGGTPSACMGDADCTMGMNGRCVFGRIGRYCSYDECFSDSDCGDNEVCLCDGTGLGGGGNSCITTSCRTNNDCGGQTCSPTLGSCGDYAGVVGYACHTASDECTVDTDCAGLGADAYCKFDPAVSHWVCSDAQCVG